MNELKQQIEKLSYDKLPFRYGEKYVKTADILKLLADCVCIPRKQLHEIFKKHYFSRALEDTLKQIELDLLRLGDEK